MKKISRIADRIVIELEPGEAGFIRSLPERAGKSVKPTRYSTEAKADAELRDLLDADLRARRVARTDSVLKQLGEAKGDRMELSDAQAEDWLGMLTDLRVALAESIGIHDDNWERSLDTSKPLSADVLLYLYLSAFQIKLLEHGFGVSQGDLPR